MKCDNTRIDWQSIGCSLQEKLNKEIAFSQTNVVSGGDIHQSFHIQSQSPKESIFIKVNHLDAFPVLESEADSLTFIADTDSILCPTVILLGKTQEHAFLIMEYHHLISTGDDYQLGKQLAEMHQSSIKQQVKPYGFKNDNFIGLTAQHNQWKTNWCDFWINCRIRPQLHLAYQNGFRSQLEHHEDQLVTAITNLLNTYQPEPCLLHGDLWSGNKAFSQKTGEPIIFDPACYYGDRETDISLTRLFGGFSALFYQGYQDTWPLNPDFEQRHPLYNLYHILNHLNLFGAGYLRQSITMIDSLIKQNK